MQSETDIRICLGWMLPARNTEREPSQWDLLTTTAAMCTLENVDPVTHVPPLLSAMCALCAHVLLFNTQLGDQLGKKLVASPKQSTPLTDQPRDIFFRITIYFKGN